MCHSTIWKFLDVFVSRLVQIYAVFGLVSNHQISWKAGSDKIHISRWIVRWRRRDYDKQGNQVHLNQDKLYLCRNRHQSQVGFHKKGKWKYSTQVAEEIPRILDTRHYRSIREIVSVYVKNRHLVFVYLETLASIGMVGIKSKGYKVLSREGILKLGTLIQPGIPENC